MAGMADKEAINVVSADVEGYFHAETFSAVVDRANWESYSSRVEMNTQRLLDLFALLTSMPGSSFLGRSQNVILHSFAKSPQRHELACHSYWQHLIYKLDREEFGRIRNAPTIRSNR